MGSLIIGISSIAAPILVISNFYKTNLKYIKRSNFSTIKDINDSFDKAKISFKTKKRYIESISKINGYDSNKNTSNLPFNIMEVQNEISMRRVNNNYSLEQLSFDINNVKSVLERDSSEYLNYFNFDENNYEYLQAIYMKNNLNSWLNLNNVIKYDLIYEYLDLIYKAVFNLFNLFNLKQIIYRKEIEKRNEKIQMNNSKILKIREEIKIKSQLIKNAQKEIVFLEKNFIFDDNYFINIKKAWNEVDLAYISATTSASIAAASAIMTFIPFVSPGAFIAGTAAAIAASSLSFLLDYNIKQLKKEIEISNENSTEDWKDISKEIKSAYFFFNIFQNFSSRLKLHILYKITNISIKFIATIAGINLFTAAISIAMMTLQYTSIRDYKNEYINSITREHNNQIQNSIKEVNSSIISLDNDVYNKNEMIFSISKENILLNEEINNITINNNNLKEQFNILPNSLISLPMISKSRIEDISNDSSNYITLLENQKLDYLYQKYDELIIEMDELKQNRKIKMEKFNKYYNYDDKVMWNEVFCNNIEPLFNLTSMLNV
ncbi:hypothetical protein [Spiroplasma endosymbiont of Cantharis rufa]|uniref:hypothetical protein n=1 Tax=Spiroplasma endosymbiont of Cantharis rufa TaxID=3066279 RepID=UPI0030CEF9ED